MQNALLALGLCIAASQADGALAAETVKPGYDILYAGDKVPHTVYKGIQADPDKEPLGYTQQRLYPLSLNTDKIKPNERFCIVISQAGTGHLEARDDSRYPKVARFAQKNGLYKFSDALRFSEEGKEPKELTLDEATKLFGTALEQQSENGVFYTISAKAKIQAEDNIYHLDFRTSKEGRIAAYRIRGIGITNPQWVTESSL